jgi:aminopeptidase N
MNGWGVVFLILFGSVGCALAQDTGGISRELARERASRVSEVRYNVSFTLNPGESMVSGEVEIRFNLRRTDPLLLDFRSGKVNHVQVNGAPSPLILDNDHLELDPSTLRKGQNDVRIEFAAPVADAGAALTRFRDRDDGSEYIYTLFVPMDASMAFPCFDQPDIKARFKLTITGPEDWMVISNTPVEGTASTETQVRTTFAETRPISTYLFAFAAGPFRRLEGAGGVPAVWVRDSVVDRAEPEVSRIQRLTSQGISYFADYFDQPFPFEKYDTVLIPGLAYGGMEHAGATFLREESILFRAAPTGSDLLRRDILVLHELAHQWFGDFVTMRWFDDLWLKEGFAQYMAFLALDSLEPGQNVWKGFYESIKPAAYAIDSTQGTTAIYQDIPNLRDAKSAYGAIVYSKAPAVLRQLAYVLGSDTFRNGLRLYLKEHPYGNAEWGELVKALATVSRRSLNKWANVWIRRRGMPQVDVAWSCQNERISQMTLSQHGVLDAGDTWPIATQVLLNYGDQKPARIGIEFDGKNTEVAAAAGKPCPTFVFANDGDYAYGRFLLDDKSRDRVITRLGSIRDPFLRTMLWGSLWESVREAQLDPRTYVEAAARLLPGESDGNLLRSVLARVTTALHRYVGDETRRRLVPTWEAMASEQMIHSQNPDLRITWFRALQGFAETPQGLGKLKDLLSGELELPDVDLRSLDRWNIVTTLLAMGDPDAPRAFDAEREFDLSGDGLKYAYAAEAARPDAQIKAMYFDEYLHADSQPEDWIERSLPSFNWWNQSDLNAPYLKKALEALPQLKIERKIFFLQRWLDAFIQGQQSAEARDEVHHFLGEGHLDKDLHLKILEAVDELDRTVAIRNVFPN